MIEVPVMIRVPAGSFIMGSSGDDKFANSTELPAHEMALLHDFEVAAFPVTESQFKSFKGTGQDSPLPVVRVSWYEAVEYTQWLSLATGHRFRLLTEAEWEYCCRAGSLTIFASGDTLDPSEANYLYDEHGFKVGAGMRTPAGSFAPNAFGLEDMHGNVCEWVADAWRSSYNGESAADFRVIRGGAWDYMPRLLRSAWRDFASPDTRRDNLGFRVACDLTAP